MCGIAGLAGEDRATIERMTAALSHRGPDGNAVVVTQGASLGHARLAILDPRPIGDQPMWNDDKTVVIVYNGEIFNYRALKEQFHLTCKTGTDTEVLLKLYEREGPLFVRHLMGMFAFGLFDTRTATWHLARDSSGIKPLFVSYPGNKLHFASEMRSLLSSMPKKPSINEHALSQYLRLQYVPGPGTMCEGIESLPPATILSWQNGKETRTSFKPLIEPKKFRSKEQFSAEFPAIMDEVVKDHLVSDRPVGIFLSGGMDSSIVLHHMSQHAAMPLRTYTVRFEATEEEGAKRFNTDADLATKTAHYYGTEHTEILLTADIYRRLYHDTARALDQPNADAVSVAQFFLSAEAKKHVDVVLCGAGGDELFGGYPRYRVARILDTLRFIPPVGREAVGRVLGYPPDVLGMRPGPKLAERLLARPNSEWTDSVRGAWFDGSATTELFEERYALLHGNDPLRAFMEFDRHLWLVDESLRLADATTMGHGLEARPPFLDPRIIAASHGTKSEWQVGLRRTIALLKDTYRKILPTHLFTLPKASFYPPLAKWIRRECAPLVEEMLEHKRIKERFDVVKLRTLFEQHKKKETYALHTLSSLMQLSAWFDEVYDAAHD